MTDVQYFWIFGLLIVLCVLTIGMAADLKKRLEVLERRNERQMDMLIALLQWVLPRFCGHFH